MKRFTDHELYNQSPDKISFRELFRIFKLNVLPWQWINCTFQGEEYPFRLSFFYPLCPSPSSLPCSRLQQNLVKEPRYSHVSPPWSLGRRVAWLANSPFLWFPPNKTPLLTAMTATGGPAIIDINFFSPMRFYKPMTTVGGENDIFVVGFKSTFKRNLFVH